MSENFIGFVHTTLEKTVTQTTISRENSILRNLKIVISHALEVDISKLCMNDLNIQNARYILLNLGKFKEEINGLLTEYEQEDKFPLFDWDSLHMVNQIWIDKTVYQQGLNIYQILVDSFNTLIDTKMSVIVNFLEDESIFHRREKIYKKSIVHTGVICKKCGEDTVIEEPVQLRSLDEGESIRKECSTCGYSSLQW